MRRLLAACLALLALAAPAMAFDSVCRPIALTPEAFIWRASAAANGLERGQARLTFVGHSSFVIQSAGGVTVETDYNDFVRAAEPPTIATMNKAHSTHFSHAPDPRIAHVLRGWDPNGPLPAEHDVTVGDVRIRNVPTNIRTWGGATEENGNSIFLIETGGLCFAHLGHLHHTLERSHLREIGRVDVLLVPVDGGWTLDTEGLFDVLKTLQPQMIVPMHFFNAHTLGRFLRQAGAYWPIVEAEGPSLVVTKATLPREPSVVVMPGTHPRYGAIVRAHRR